MQLLNIPLAGPAACQRAVRSSDLRARVLKALPAVVFLFVAPTFSVAQAVAPVEGSSTTDEPLEMSALEVSASSNVGYSAQYASSATRDNQRYIDVAQTLNVVTSELLEDAAVFDSREFAQFVPNFTPRANTHQPETFFSRGFQITTTYVDGYETAMGYNRDSALYDRVGFVKGPASAAMGRGEAGGLVNYVSKKPTGKTFANTRATFGTDNFSRGELDLGGVVDKKGKLSYRVPLYFEDSDDVRGSEINHRQKYGIGPSVLWRLSPNTDILLNSVYAYFNGAGNVGSAWWSHPDFYLAEVERGQNVGSNWNPYDYPLVPKDRVYGYGVDGRESEAYAALLLLRHRFNDAISFRQGVRWQDISDVRRQVSSPSGVLDNPDDPDDFLVPITYRYDERSEVMWRAQGDLLIKASTGWLDHQLILGYDAFDQEGEVYGGNKGGALLRQSLYHPDFSLPEGFDPDTYVTSFTRNQINWRSGVGYFGQYTAKLLNKSLVFEAGWRADDTSSQRLNRRNDTLGDEIEDHTEVPRFSLRWAPTPWLTAYILHSEQQEPPNEVSKYANFTEVGNGTLPPESDPIYDETVIDGLGAILNEIGVKGTFFDGKFTATMSLFDVKRTNYRINTQKFVSTGPTANDGYTVVERYLTTGDEVKGFEAQLIGQPTDRLTLMFSLGLMNGSRPDPDGVVTPIESLIDTLKMRGKYSFRDQSRNGLDVTWGIDYYFKGWTVWQASNVKFSDDQVGIDLGGAYYWARGRYSVQLNIKNLNNELIHLSPNSQWSLRRVLVSFAAKF